MTNLLPEDGEVYFEEHFFSKEESDHFFKALLQEINWKQEPIKIFGKLVMQPRLTAWYGDPEASYSYSGINLHPEDWNATLKEIKNKIELHTGKKFNSALLNLYRNQVDSMGFHRDNEKELGLNPTIASVSFGEEREFQFKHIKKKELKKSLVLTHGSLLLMTGSTQHHWQHALPKRAKEMGARINITFRYIFTPKSY